MLPVLLDLSRVKKETDYQDKRGGWPWGWCGLLGGALALQRHPGMHAPRPSFQAQECPFLHGHLLLLWLLLLLLMLLLYHLEACRCHETGP